MIKKFEEFVNENLVTKAIGAFSTSTQIGFAPFHRNRKNIEKKFDLVNDDDAVYFYDKSNKKHIGTLNVKTGRFYHDDSISEPEVEKIFYK